jgi:hypothetical protein
MNSKETIKADDIFVGNQSRQGQLGEPDLHASGILNEILKSEFMSMKLFRAEM